MNDDRPKLRHFATLLLATALGLLLAGPARRAAGQHGNFRIGNEVIQKRPTFVLRLGDRARDGKGVIQVYRVGRVEGPWLWLEAPGAAGFALADEVVPVEQAIDHFTNAVRANPSDGFAWTVRAMLWERKGEYDKAIADYNEAIRLDPTAAYVYHNRGIAWHAKKEYDKAIADYNEAIRLDPKDALAYNNRGWAWQDKQEYDKAIADYNEAIRLDPKDASAYYNRGVTWGNKKEYDNAIADYNEAIRLDPKDAFAYNNRGWTWQNKKEYDKAIADYNEAIRLDSTYSPAYNGRAWLWATCPDAKYRDGKKAVESATKACELSEWKEAYCIGTLAAAYAEAGDFDAAVKWQSKANGLYTDTEDKSKGQKWLKLYREHKPYRE